MATISTANVEMIVQASKIIERRMKTFSAEDQQTMKAFCSLAAEIEAKHEIAKEKHREQMKRFRSDPSSADRAREQTREAARRFREKHKVTAK